MTMIRIAGASATTALILSAMAPGAMAGGRPGVIVGGGDNSHGEPPATTATVTAYGIGAVSFPDQRILDLSGEYHVGEGTTLPLVLNIVQDNRGKLSGSFRPVLADESTTGPFPAVGFLSVDRARNLSFEFGGGFIPQPPQPPRTGGGDDTTSRPASGEGGPAPTSDRPPVGGGDGPGGGTGPGGGDDHGTSTTPPQQPQPQPVRFAARVSGVLGPLGGAFKAKVIAAAPAPASATAANAAIVASYPAEIVPAKEARGAHVLDAPSVKVRNGVLASTRTVTLPWGEARGAGLERPDRRVTRFTVNPPPTPWSPRAEDGVPPTAEETRPGDGGTSQPGAVNIPPPLGLEVVGVGSNSGEFRVYSARVAVGYGSIETTGVVVTKSEFTPTEPVVTKGAPTIPAARVRF